MLSNNFIDFLASFIIIVPVLLVVISFHEFSHALTAYLLGDETSKDMGRLTLNPFAHLDFWGTICLLIFRIGWAKPVVFNINNFKRPRLYSVLTALAGPLSNFILAFISFFLIKFLPVNLLPEYATKTFLEIFQVSAYFNIMLGTFNLIPLPPLDGSHIIIALLYKKHINIIIWLYKYSMFILLLLLFIPATRTGLSNLVQFIYNFIQNLVL